jgi:uncharacterized protein YggT (Ycf19 family)
MFVILRICCFIQRTSCGLRYVNRVPCQIQCICTAISNFQDHNSNRTDLPCCWGYVDYSMFVILRICCFIQRTLSSFCYVNRVPGHIQCIHHELFNFRGQKSNRTYLRCCWGYVDYSMFVILRICSFIQRTSCGLRYVNRVPCQIQCIHYELFNFRGQKSNRTYLRCCWGYVDYSMFVILRICCFIQCTSSGLRYVNRVPCQIQCICTAISNFQDHNSNRTYLPCCWGYVDYSMFVVLRICSFIRRTSSSFCYVNRVPGHIQCIHHELLNFRGQKSNPTNLPCYWGYVDYSMFDILRIYCFIRRTSSSFCYVNRVPGYIQCIHHELLNFRGQNLIERTSPAIGVM